MALKILWIIDPLEKLKRTDSSLFLAHLAENLGFENHVSYGVRLVESRLRTQAAPLKVTLEGADGLIPQAGTFSDQNVLDFDIVLNRLEPPLSEAYLQQCRLLMFHPRVLNSPVTLQSYMEKYLPLYFGVGVTTSTGPMRVPHEGIAKPLHLFGGMGVEKVAVGTELDADTLFQEFLPEVKQGELRVLMIGSELFGGINKIPREGEFRSNSAHGSRMEYAPVPDRVRLIAQDLAPKLQEIGVDFAAIDFIGEQVIEINITCPSLYFQFYQFMGGAERLRLSRALEAVLKQTSL